MGVKKAIAKDKTCKNCGGKFNRGVLRSGRAEGMDDFRRRKFCRQQCYFEFNTGDNHHHYKPEGSLNRDGYVRVSFEGRRVLLHRLRMEHRVGRPLQDDEHVHHIDGDRLNNRIENLIIIKNKEHAKMHSPHRKRNKKGQYA